MRRIAIASISVVASGAVAARGFQPRDRGPERAALQTEGFDVRAYPEPDMFGNMPEKRLAKVDKDAF